MNLQRDCGLPLDTMLVPRIARQHICFVEKEGETEVEQKVETETQVEPTAEEKAAAEAAAAEASATAEAEAEAAAAKAKTVPAWQLAAAQKRIDKLTAKLAATESKPADGPKDAAGKPLFTEEQAAQMAQEFARQENERQAFDEACGQVVLAGKQLFPDDWQPRLEALIELKDDRDPDSVNAYNTFIQAAVASGEGARVLHELAGDLDEAMRIMALSPIKMTAELTKRAAKMEPVGKSTPSDVSQTPKPITPIGGRKAGTFDEIHPDDPSRADKLDSVTWHSRRQKQVEERGLR